ncbi:WbqC family protein [Balneolales bacterium ANBcel1]|nr:WbqC family protein [Balneolales bacterium ANBcel1]
MTRNPLDDCLSAKSSGNASTPSAPVTALLLPGYSPDLAWMARALHADRVILDDRHLFSRKSRVHRTKIRTPDGHQWLSLPVVTEDRRKPINRVRIDDRRPWLQHHLQALEFNYRNSLYFDYYEPEIRADLQSAANYELLLDAVRHLMQRQWIYLQLPKFPTWAGELAPGATTSRSDRSSESVRPNDTTHKSPSVSPETKVWQEPNSRNYQKPHPNASQPDFQIPEYRQHFPGFVPGCGVLDVLFEYGPETWQVLEAIQVNPARSHP